jgi:hypothetical protein
MWHSPVKLVNVTGNPQQTQLRKELKVFKHLGGLVPSRQPLSVLIYQPLNNSVLSHRL